jgi:hypothetical protein
MSILLKGNEPQVNANHASQETQSREFTGLTAHEVAELRAMFAPSESLSNDAENSQTPLRAEAMLDFFEGLYISGLLDGVVEPGERLLDEALEILERAKANDPGNGVYSFFRAKLLSDLGRDADEIMGEFIDAFRAERFDAHYARIANMILKLGRASSARLLLAISLASRMPTPKIFDVVLPLRDALAKNPPPELVRQMGAFGQRLMDETAAKRDDWLPLGQLDYSLGRALVVFAFRMLNPGAPDPGIPTFPENDQWTQNEKLVAEAAAALRPDGACDRTKLDELLKHVRSDSFH